MLSAGFQYAQLDIGFREHWLSPFTHSAMLISTQAKTQPSVTLSNYTPISRLGLSYEMFLAEMDYSDQIASPNGGTTAGRPRLAGLRFAIEPATGRSLGANRIFQYGGGDRGGDSFGDFFDALFDSFRRQLGNAGGTEFRIRQSTRIVDEQFHISRADTVFGVPRICGRGSLV